MKNCNINPGGFEELVGDRSAWKQAVQRRTEHYEATLRDKKKTETSPPSRANKRGDTCERLRLPLVYQNLQERSGAIMPQASPPTGPSETTTRELTSSLGPDWTQSKYAERGQSLGQFERGCFSSLIYQHQSVFNIQFGLSRLFERLPTI